MFKKTFTTKNIAGIAVFAALSFILYLPFLEIPLFPGTPYKLDFSNVFVLLGGFMYGPVGGVIILVIKELLHLTVGTTAGVGELANLIVGLSYILLPTVVYYFKKGFITVVWTLILACFIQIGVGMLANKYILLPFFNSAEMFEPWFWYIFGLNAIKSVICSIFSILFYKKLSVLFKKINLQESGGDGIIKKDKKEPFETVTSSAEETIALARNYAKTLKAGDVVVLSGDLGAGKTHFTKGIAEGLGIEDNVTSPTYAYLNVYGDYLYHFDFYRLSSGEEALALGLADYFGKDNICILEWAENVPEILPEKVKTVKIEKIGENERKISL